MRKAPKIGTRVQVKRGHRYYPCVGTVMAIYPTYEYDDENDRPTNRLEPEREWHVGVKVDSIPQGWGYGERDRFAPPVSEIEQIR